jgi:DNA primase
MLHSLDIYRKTYNEIYSKVNLEKVLKYYNLEYRSYRGQKGKEYECVCPFHDDSTPSFSIQENTGVFNCFVCGGGDFLKFIKLLEGLKTTESALAFVKKQIGQEENVDVFSIVKNSTDVFIQNSKENKLEETSEQIIKEIVLPDSEPAENFFDIVKKRVCLSDVKKYGMRYCVDDRIYHERLIIPVYMHDKLVTFAARDMSGKAEAWGKVKAILKQKKLSKQDKQKFIDKYMYKKILYPFGTQMGKLFFNWDEAIKQKEVIICEGIFSAIAIINFGYNALALLSCHLNLYKAKKLLENFERVYIALDNDDKVDAEGERINPGQDSAQKIMKDFLTDIQVFNIVLPFGKDPDDCTQGEFDQAFENAKKMQNMFTLSLQ